MDGKKANSMAMDCSSKILKNTEGYVSQKLQYVYKQTSNDLFGVRLPSHVLRTALFLSVVIFASVTRLYLINEPKHIW
jgi:hypothetical protein